MKCIECEAATEVLRTYHNVDGAIKRRRHCVECGARFTTRERADQSSIEPVVESVVELDDELND
jgi:transcriptional regulator NrdR family protein